MEHFIGRRGRPRSSVDPHFVHRSVAYDVVRGPAYHEHNGNHEDHDGYFTDGSLGLVLQGHALHNQVAQEQQITEHHDADGQNEAHDQLEIGPEPLVGERVVSGPEDPTGMQELGAVVAQLRQRLGVDPVGHHDDAAYEPEPDAHAPRVLGRPVPDAAQWVDDSEVAVDAHEHHGEDARVQVDSVQRAHDLAEPRTKQPVLGEGAVGEEGEAEHEEIIGDGEVEDETRGHRLHLLVLHDHHDRQRVAENPEQKRDEVEHHGDVSQNQNGSGVVSVSDGA